MPKLINREQRKQEIAQAVWAVLKREGVRGVSVRTVAAESGISTGSLRHVFPSFDEMMMFSLNYAGQRFVCSLSAQPSGGSIVQRLIERYILAAPSTPEGRLFAIVAAGMLAEAATLPGSFEIVGKYEADFAAAYRFLLGIMRSHNLLKPDVDIEQEAAALVALLMGVFTVSALSGHSASTQELQQPLILHLDTLLLTPSAEIGGGFA